MSPEDAAPPVAPSVPGWVRTAVVLLGWVTLLSPLVLVPVGTGAASVYLARVALRAPARVPDVAGAVDGQVLLLAAVAALGAFGALAAKMWGVLSVATFGERTTEEGLETANQAAQQAVETASDARDEFADGGVDVAETPDEDPRGGE